MLLQVKKFANTPPALDEGFDTIEQVPFKPMFESVQHLEMFKRWYQF
jgi:hypothetical protein